MKPIFTSEPVTEGHPDKVSDRISASVLVALLEGDKFSHVVCKLNEYKLSSYCRKNKISNRS